MDNLHLSSHLKVYMYTYTFMYTPSRSAVLTVCCTHVVGTCIGHLILSCIGPTSLCTDLYVIAWFSPYTNVHVGLIREIFLLIIADTQKMVDSHFFDQDTHNGKPTDYSVKIFFELKV